MQNYRNPWRFFAPSHSGHGASVARLAGIGVLLLSICLAGGEDPAETPPLPPGLKANSASIGALSVSKSGDRLLCGHASRMTLSASTHRDPEAEASLDVEEGNGGALRASLDRVREFFESQKRWPAGARMILGFENASHPHEGGSFSVGVALLIDAMQTGVPVDDQVSVTGKLTGDGSIVPVGGVTRKIEAAYESGVPVVLIPSGNAAVIRDMLVMQGPGVLVHSQIIGVDCFEEAREIATSKRNPEVTKALALFKRLAKAMRKRSEQPEELTKLLKHPRVIETLDQILAAIPEHLAAQGLSMEAKGVGPKVLSPRGSAREISRIWPKILGSSTSGGNEGQEELATLTPLLDPITDKYAASVRAYAGLLKELKNSTDSAGAKHEQLRKAGSLIDTERRYLQQKLHDLHVARKPTPPAISD